MLRLTPRPTLFPYTTLFRSNRVDKLKDQMKKPKPAKEREADQEEMALLQRIVAAFEQGQYAATLGLKEDEEKAIRRDRKSTRLNSSHVSISYAVFCLKKKTR